MGKPQFSVDYYEGVTMLTKQVKLANAYQYMDAANEAYGNDHSGQVLYTPQYIEATKKANGLLPNDNPKMYNPYCIRQLDWMDELFRDMGITVMPISMSAAALSMPLTMHHCLITMKPVY